MKHVKRILMIVLAAIMVLSFAACENNQQTAEPTDPPKTTNDVRVIALKGPTGMGMAKLMEDGYKVDLVSAPEEISAEIIKGSVDIAAVPVNLASTLYKKTEGAIQIAAVNTLGTLHVVENGETVKSIADLKGKTVYFTGEGTTPEYTLRYILTQNGIDPDNDLEIIYLSEHAELATKMMKGDVTLGILPEPFVTSAMFGNDQLRDAIDLSDEWDKVAAEDSKLTMGCIVVRKEYAENNKEALNKFLDDYKASIDFVNNDMEAGAELIAKYRIVSKASVAEKAIPGCNMTFLAGEEMKTAAGGFLKVMFDANPKSIGGAMPDDMFYYMG